MDAVLHLYLFVAFLSICLDKAESQIPQAKIEELIQRRNLRSVGYTHFDVSHLHETGADDSYPANLVNSDTLRRRKRDINSTATNPATTFRLEAHGNSFAFSVVHTRPALHPDGIVQFTAGDTSRIWRGTNQDCFMMGKLASHEAQTAVFSFCGNLKGYFSDSDSTYWVESLEYYDRSGDSSSRMLVAKKPSSLNLPTPTFVKRDVGARREAINKIKKHGKRRQKRQATTYSIDIELAVVADELATAEYTTQGARSDDEKVEMMQLKWVGVQAEYAKLDDLDIFSGAYKFENTKISLKAVEFYETNPAWLNPNSVLLTYLEDSFCPGLYNNNKYRDYDHIQLITGVANPQPNGGVSPYAKICSTNKKCSVVAAIDLTSYWVPAHELGHNLNMFHDYEHDENAVCLNKTSDGIMGTEYKGWTTCSGEDLVLFLELGDDGTCLFTTDVTDASVIDLAGLWPGMQYSDDEICALKYAEGWRYRANPSSNPSSCPYYTCINMNLDSASYGTMLGSDWTWTINGKSCGDDMYCYIYLDGGSNTCITWADTGLPDSVKVVVPGGWSAWGPETSSCSRDCGTGTTFKQRKCNNPKPMFSPWCEGSEYEATLCSMDPCPGDSPTESQLIIERASETCDTLVTQGLIPESEKFASTGTKYSNAAHGQCEVKCDLLDPAVTSTTKRFGLMPDGTPCTDDSLDDLQETFQMIRRPGQTAKCLQGYCHIFGCDNKHGSTIKQFDGCGVCGGTNYICDVFEGVFSDNLANGERRDLITIPSGATLIQIWFKYNDNKKHWLELWSTPEASEEAIIASKISGDSQITDNVGNPKSFAGTGWTYLQSAQYLSAPGPTNEDVQIKVYYTGSGTNSGINWAYSIPKDVTTTDEPTTPEPTTPEPTTPEPTTPDSTTQAPTTLSSMSTSTKTLGGRSVGSLLVVPPKINIFLCLLCLLTIRRHI